MDCRLIHGECLTEMKKLIDEGVQVELVLTDIPYGTTRNKWDTIIPLEEMWECINQLSDDSTPCCLFSQFPFTVNLGMSNIENLRYEWVWEKEQGTGHLNANRMPLKKHENILVFYKKLPTYNPQMSGDEKRVIKRNGKIAKTSNYGEHIEIPKSEYVGRYPTDIIQFNKDKIKLHPTQKPVALLEYMIKTYTNENDTVLDFTMGSGSTGVACVNTNRKFIGIELEKEYYDMAVERVNNYQTNLI